MDYGKLCHEKISLGLLICYEISVSRRARTAGCGGVLRKAQWSQHF